MTMNEPQAGTITTAQAARLLMVTEDWIRQLSRNGYLAKAGRDSFNLVAVVQCYIKYLKDDERRSSRSAADSRVRDARAAEIERRMAREDRDLIMLDEAMAAYDFATGLYLASVSGLPARMTRNASERRRLEAICDGERQRLADRFAEGASALRTGEAAIDADDEDDA